MNALKVILQRYAWRQPWFFLGCLTLALGIGTITVKHLGTWQSSPITATNVPIDSRPLQDRRDDSNTPHTASRDRQNANTSHDTSHNGQDTRNDLNAPDTTSRDRPFSNEAVVLADSMHATSSTTQTTAFTHAGESPREVPHPLTPGHERLFAINRVAQQARQAIDLRDVPRLRGLLAQYATLDPKDALRQRLGFERIADCLESPGAASRQAALSFWQKETASPVRRLVRRRCLESP